MDAQSDPERDNGLMHEQQSLNEHPALPNHYAKPAQRNALLPIATLAKGLIASALLLALIIALSRPHSTIPPAASAAPEIRMSLLAPQPFPKILWILCGEGGLEGLPMMEAVVARHQMAVALASGYEVRVVDLLNAYDWLSAETSELIRKAKHNSQFHIPVGELLRIALLLEHGGVSAKLDSIVFAQRLDWIEATINADKATLRKLEEESAVRYCGSSRAAEVLLFAEGGHGMMKWFDVGLLIARPNSKLLGEVFMEMVDVLRRSRRAYDAFHNFGWYNNDRALSMQDFLYNLLSFRNHYWNTALDYCRQYQVLEINRKEGSFMRTLYVWPRIVNFLMKDRSLISQEEGRTKVLNVDMKALRPQMMEVAKFQSLGDAHPNSVFREMVKAEGNNWLLKPISNVREVCLCIISLKPLPASNYKELIHRSLSAFDKDAFKNWQAVFFAEGLAQKVVDYSSDPEVKLVNSSEWEGLNLQRAATKYCDPSAIGVLLNYDESFVSPDTLSQIAQQFTDRRVYAAFLTAKINEKTIQPSPDIALRTKSAQERLHNLAQIGRSLRAFSIYSYRLVGQFDLHDAWGRYFDREIAFNTLMQMQNTVNDRCEETEMKYHVKQAESHGKELPRSRVYLNELVVVMPAERTPDTSLPEYTLKHDAHEWCESLEEYYERIKSSLDGFFVLNNGSEFEGLQNRRHLPKLIPSKIHQVWIGNTEMPAFKQQLMDHAKALYPTWEHRLWTNADITRENFPLTYELMQALFEFDKRSPTDKMAMISDIMRLEVLYWHGGFYFDTNYYIFRPDVLEDWRSFEEVFVGQLVPFYKFQRENSIMACVPKSPRFLRLLDHRRLSSRNFFNRWANLESGPAYVTFALQGEEEMSPTVFQPGYEWVYPWYYSSNSPNLCEAPLDTADSELLFKKRNAYWKNCSELYKGAFGIQFFLEGGSWMNDRE